MFDVVGPETQGVSSPLSANERQKHAKIDTELTFVFFTKVVNIKVVLCFDSSGVVSDIGGDAETVFETCI